MQPGGGGSPLHLGCSPVCPGAVLAYSACLESHRGAACTFATGGLPAVVHRGALSGDEMRLIASPHAHVPESGSTATFSARESGRCASSGHACRHWTPRRGEGPRGPRAAGRAAPPPRLLEPTPSIVADSTAFGRLGFARTRAA